MKSLLISTLATSALGAALPSVPAAPLVRRSGTIWATPHESYSSSVGVLGCKIDTNRVAYWPGSISCDNICVKITLGERSTHLLRIDTSEGAYDMSYDAWNWLQTGEKASVQPTSGGPVAMEYEDVDMSECADLIKEPEGKLALSAANSMNYLASCLAQPSSWVAQNYRLYNVLDPICTLGTDEACTLDWPAANQASCPTSQLGAPVPLPGEAVVNVQYGTGVSVLAGTGEVVEVEEQKSESAEPLTPTKSRIDFSYDTLIPGAMKAEAAPAESKVPEVVEGSKGNSGAGRTIYVPVSIIVPVLVSLWMG